MHGVEIHPFAAIGSRKVLKPTPSPTQLIMKVLFSEVKWQEHEADNLPPSNAEDLNHLTCTFKNYFLSMYAFDKLIRWHRVFNLHSALLERMPSHELLQSLGFYITTLLSATWVT
jgi:hypothetical protein